MKKYEEKLWERKKVVLDQFDFIRAIACLGIVLYHFAVEYGWPDIFNNYVGGVTYGDIYVTVFFLHFRCITIL